MAICAYVRVSSDKQTNENQRFEVTEWCKARGWAVDRWVADDGVSGAKDYKKRKLGQLLDSVNAGDTIIASEISRFGRDLMMVMEILRNLLSKNVSVYTIRDHFVLSDDIQSRVIAFAFGLAAEIERRLIQQRTKAALDRLKLEGVVLGRKKGVKNKETKLSGKLSEIEQMILDGKKKADICRAFNVNRQTLLRFLQAEGRRDLILDPPRQIKISEEAVRMCADRGMTKARAARTLCVSAGSIAKYAKKFGVEFHEDIEGAVSIESVFEEIDLLKDSILNRHSSGESFVDIRKSLGYSASIWHKWMKRHGLLYSRDIEMARSRVYEMRALLNSGLSYRQISNAMRIYEDVVRRVLSENGANEANHKMTLRDLTEAQRGLAKERGIPARVLSQRINRGWDIIDAITAPVQKRVKKGAK